MYGKKTVYRGRTLSIGFKMDRKGIAACAMGPELLASVISIAEKRALPYAVSISPRTTRKHVHYQDSFLVIPGTVVIRDMMRVAARLANVSRQASRVEWGVEANDQRGQRILGRTMDHLHSLKRGN